MDFVYSLDVKKMMEKSNWIYKSERKTRKVKNEIWENDFDGRNRYTDRYRTETYTEQTLDRVEKIEVYKNSINLSLEGRSLIENLPKYLPNQFLDTLQKDFTIETWEMNRDESWIFALPQKWF